MAILGYRKKRYLYPYDLEHITSFDFVCDLPLPYSFTEWDEKIPGSKFVLTTRSRESWLRSVVHHHQRRGKPRVPVQPLC
ncbi:MAG: hypothetical protein JRH16_01265 [Deltaproteobacteria bacterium]|nr:hypothetical protein [Deltaproteobacteria bacterium]